MKETEKLAYQLRARADKLYQLRKKKAHDLLRQFATLVERPYFSMSWGKDSVIAYCLVREIWSDIRVVYVNCGEFDEWPDTERVKKILCGRFNINLVEVKAESVIEGFRRVGYWYPPPAKTEEERLSDQMYSDSFFDAIASVTKDCDGFIMGLRAEESSGRESLFTHRGPIYYRRKDHRYVCCPLHDWSTEDIWTFHVEYNLPYNELYDCPAVEKRRRRNGAMFGGTGSARGGMKIAKRLYPELFNRFAAEFPEVRCYV